MSNYYRPTFERQDTETGVLLADDLEDIGANQTGGTSNTVLKLIRQRFVIGGTTRSGVADVLNTAPTGTEYGLLVRVVSAPGTSASTSTTGMTIFRNTALSNSAVAVKAGAGNLYSYHIVNDGTVKTYIQFYNTAQGSVTVGTTTPVLTWEVPAGGILDGQHVVPFGFATAITIAATTTVTGGTAPVTALLVNLGYA